MDCTLTHEEVGAIINYTIQKINHYPKEYGKTVDNYFDILFPDEVKAYLMRRDINRRSEEILRRKEMAASYV